MQVIDTVLFQLPKDPELQVAAVSVYQAFVNTYDERVKANDVAGVKCVRCGKRRTAPEKCLHCGERQAVPIASYRLVHDHTMPEVDWQKFVAAGLVLKTLPVRKYFEDGGYEMLVDLRDERIMRYKDSGKHVCQICAVMASAVSVPLPIVRQIKPRMTEDFVWGVLGPMEAAWVPELPMLSLRQLLGLEDAKYTGFIGHASRETYLAAAMGFPVVEVIPADRPRRWLSKHTNLGYRAVENYGNVAFKIRQGMDSIEAGVRRAIAEGRV